MLGFSIYLSNDLTKVEYDYLHAMSAAGFGQVFTSLQLPEDDPRCVLKRLVKLSKWCEELNLGLIADVSAMGLKRLGIDLNQIDQIQELNLSGLRIDDGVSPQLIAELSHTMPLALNASTITDTEVNALIKQKANFENLQAWHNYYPRPETGLDEKWLEQKNLWLHKAGLATMAFVAGDAEKRGPIKAGLPTLEKQRNMHPLAATLELKNLGCDNVFIGDASLTNRTKLSFANYVKDKTLTLTVTGAVQKLTDYTWHNRLDVASYVVRLEEGRKRQLFDTVPQAKPLPRPKGTITCDNSRYLRYQGELQISKRSLPADERVNVLGRVIPADLALLDFVGAHTKLCFEVI